MGAGEGAGEGAGGGFCFSLFSLRSFNVLSVAVFSFFVVLFYRFPSGLALSASSFFRRLISRIFHTTNFTYSYIVCFAFFVLSFPFCFPFPRPLLTMQVNLSPALLMIYTSPLPRTNGVVNEALFAPSVALSQNWSIVKPLYCCRSTSSFVVLLLL